MQLKRVTIVEMRLRQRMMGEVDAPLMCFICNQRLTSASPWSCDDQDVSPKDRMLANVVYLCDGCADDEAGIRQHLHDHAATYDADDPDHAASLRRMADSLLTRQDRLLEEGMARFTMDDWLQRRGFAHGMEGNQQWWSYPAGLIYFFIDLIHEGNQCVIYDYRSQLDPTRGVGTRKVYTREQYEADTGDVSGNNEECWGHSWLEYRFAWPKTLTQVEVIAEAMGWNNPEMEPKDTPLEEWVAGVDELLKPRNP